MKLDDRCPALGDLGVGRVAQHSFVPLGLLGRLSDFTSGGDFLLHAFDYTNSHSLTHVAHCETTCMVERSADRSIFTMCFFLLQCSTVGSLSLYLEEMCKILYTYQVEGTLRSSQHTWACQESCQQWRHLLTWGIWGCPPASCQSGDRSFPWAPQTCRRCELCDSRAQVHSQHWFGQGD